VIDYHQTHIDGSDRLYFLLAIGKLAEYGKNNKKISKKYIQEWWSYFRDENKVNHALKTVRDIPINKIEHIECFLYSIGIESIDFDYSLMEQVYSFRNILAHRLLNEPIPIPSEEYPKFVKDTIANILKYISEISSKLDDALIEQN
ncbi:hypothetical protein K8R78_03225, partial [bacterium]|nr:hypothetical protein [bacterium]